MSRHKTITLLILVYKGGELWDECWQSVKRIQNNFDEVIIGINQSPVQDVDLNICNADLAENGKIFLQPRNINYIEHLTWLISKVNSDYIFFLCHDDFIMVDGVKEMKTLINKCPYHPIGIFGSQMWIYPDHEELKLELASYQGVMALDEFIAADAAKHFSFNLSGIVGHAESIKNNLAQSKIFSGYGFRFDNWVLTQQNIKSIHQTKSPTVKIRVHSGQLGKSTASKERALDNIAYYFIVALYSKSTYLCQISIQKIFTLLMSGCFLSGMYHMLSALYRSLSWQGDRRYLALFMQILSYMFTQAPNKLISRLRRKSEIN